MIQKQFYKVGRAEGDAESEYIAAFVYLSDARRFIEMSLIAAFHDRMRDLSYTLYDLAGEPCEHYTTDDLVQDEAPPGRSGPTRTPMLTLKPKGAL